MAANVQLAAGTPLCVGLWQYLAAIMKTPSQMGANPHTSILV